MVMTGWVIVIGLVLGTMVSRYPFYRSWMVLGIVAAMALGWTAVLPARRRRRCGCWSSWSA